jgi:hypothetical protein
MATRSLPSSLLDELYRAIAALLAILATIGAIFAEMQALRRAAHKRHPFVEM